MMFCPNCGTELEDDSQFCHECGTRIDTETIEDAKEPEQTRFVEDDIDFGTPSDQMGFDGNPSIPPSQRTTATMSSPNDISSNTMFAPMEGQQGMNFVAGGIHTAAQTNTGVQQGGGNRTAIAVAAIAVVAIAVVAIIAFLALRPSGEAIAKHSIQYETDGGTAIAASQVEDGTPVTSPANPTKNGYEFDGWFSDAEHTQQVSFPFEADEDIVLYAKWTEVEDSAETADPVVAQTDAGQTAQSSSNVSTPSGSTVNITVQGSDGTTRTASIHRQGSTERVLPNGNSRRYSASELASLSDAERCIAWNEIIAASNGYAFKNSGLANYFGNCSWYYPNAGASAGGNLTADGSANVSLLQSMTDSWWLHLAAY